LCAGPWSGALLDDLPITGIRAHSITVRSPLKAGTLNNEREEISPYALFTRIQMPSTGSPTRKNKRHVSIESPEIYARPNEEVYICGGTDSASLPDMKFGTKGVEVSKVMCEELFNQVSSISSVLSRGEITARQACYLPTPTSGPSGCPIVGEVEGVAGLVVATGHTCWGICNAPGTAKVVSELMLDGKVRCCRVDSMSPNMFM